MVKTQLRNTSAGERAIAIPTNTYLNGQCSLSNTTVSKHHQLVQGHHFVGHVRQHCALRNAGMWRDAAPHSIFTSVVSRHTRSKMIFDTWFVGRVCAVAWWDPIDLDGAEMGAEMAEDRRGRCRCARRGGSATRRGVVVVPTTSRQAWQVVGAGQKNLDGSTQGLEVVCNGNG